MIILLIILTLLIIFSFLKKEKFVIEADTIPTDSTNIIPIKIEEQYTWPCTGCDYTIPKFSYNISDSRCLKAVSYSNDINDIISYKINPTSNYESCDSVINTMYSSVFGRYLILANDIKFTINWLSIHNKDTTLLSITNANSYVDNFQYLDPLLNSGNMFSLTSQYIQIDLGSNIEIGFIKIQNNTQIVLSIVKDTGSINNGVLVSNTIIPINNKITIVYTQNNGSGINIDLSRSISFPCTGCLTYSGNLYKGFKYSTDYNCFVPNNYISSSYLTDILNGYVNQTEINNMFSSCSKTKDTRIIKTPMIDVLLIGGGGGGGNITGTGRSIRIVGGFGGAGEVVEILGKIIKPGTRIDLVAGRSGLSITDYYSYYLTSYSYFSVQTNNQKNGSKGENSNITIGTEKIEALGGGSGGAQGYNGTDGGSGGGGGLSFTTIPTLGGKSLSMIKQQDGTNGTSTTIGIGGGSCRSNCSKITDGYTSQFINYLGSIIGVSTNITRTFGRSSSNMLINSVNSNGSYYVASVSSSKMDPTFATSKPGYLGNGGGPTSAEAVAGCVIIRSTVQAVDHNAYMIASDENYFIYGWYGYLSVGQNINNPTIGYIQF
jgi:hypothetical protein